VKLVRRYGYNRLPVYDGNVANIVGVVTLTVWDLMEQGLLSKTLAELVEKPLYVSPMQNIDDLLPTLRERYDRMAIVVDEFGSAVGMITVEDILEEVVGEIEVGYDFDEYRPRRKRHYQRLGEDVYLMDSRVPVSDVNDLLDIDLPATEFHTVGGFVETTLRRIPKVGESVVEAGWRFSVAEATERAVVKLRVERV
jgi:CBS domain containing-hemolysin-like protein